METKDTRQNTDTQNVKINIKILVHFLLRVIISLLFQIDG